MMQSKVPLIILLTFATSLTFAQKRKEHTSTQKQDQSQPTALDPLPQQKQYAPAKSKKKSSRHSSAFQAEQDFYDRMAKLEKTKRKSEEIMKKPQYSDPMYFGHKKPPKKRKPGKMKYCKECGLRH